MPTRSTPALRIAIGFIESLRLKNARKGGRLPTIAALARQAGVSLATMHQAVRLLAGTGLLSVRQQAGIRWADPAVAAPLPAQVRTPAARAGRSERLADEIESGVLCGALSDPLPSVKELRARYRAGHTAISRALAEAAGRGSIVRRGRRWVVARTESRLKASKIVLIAPGDTMALFAAYDSKVADFCTALERECAMQGTAVQFQTAFRPVYPDPSALGNLVVASHEPENVAAILGALQPAGRPAVIMDILGDCPLPKLTRLPRVSVVRIQGACPAARQVAMMLRDLGHNRVAYLSPYTTKGTTWVGDRLAGLRDVYGDRAVAFLGSDLDSIGTVDSIVRTEVFPDIDGDLLKLAKSVSRHTGPVDSAWLGQQLAMPLRDRLIESRLEPLFRQALSDTSITAWVGANDQVALSGLRFLSARNVAVPRRISVAGFDGSPEAMLADLTSYDFNAPAVVKASLELILRPHVAIKSAVRILDIPGVLAPRVTVGPNIIKISNKENIKI